MLRPTWPQAEGVRWRRAACIGIAESRHVGDERGDLLRRTGGGDRRDWQPRLAGINVTFATQTTRVAPPLSYDAGGGVCVPIDMAGASDALVPLTHSRCGSTATACH